MPDIDPNYILLPLLLLSAVALAYLKVTEYVRSKESIEQLKFAGFLHIFEGSSHEFIAFNDEGDFRLGSLTSKYFYENSVSVISSAEPFCHDDGRVRVDKFLIYMDDLKRPSHEISYRNRAVFADKEWARFKAVFNQAQYVTLKKSEGFELQDSRIKILFLASNPVAPYQLKLDEEIREITQKIRGTKYRNLMELVSEWAVQPADLQQALVEHKPDVLHFSGHGSNSDELIFQDNDGCAQAVSKAAITDLVRILSKPLKLVIFNACFSDVQARSISEYVLATVGMNDEISDDAARNFSGSFYSAIGSGESVGKSFDHAKNALMIAGIPEEKIPELFVRDGLIADRIFLLKK